MRPLDIGELTPLHRRVRRRARVASWAAVPLFLLLGVGWFLFRIVNCQSGLVSPFQHRVCEEAYLVPVAAFGLAMVVAAGLALALGELGAGVVRSARVLGEPIEFGEKEGRARRVIRHLRHVPHGYRYLEDPHRSSVVIAMRVLAAGAGLMIGFLPYNYFYVFPPLLGLLVAVAVFAIVVYLSRRPARAETPRSSPDDLMRPGPMAST